MELGALKRAEDDDRYIVRLVETSGRATVAHLHFAFAVEASETDLLESELADGFRARGAVIDVPLKSFEIKTISMRRFVLTELAAACAHDKCGRDRCATSPPTATPRR